MEKNNLNQLMIKISEDRDEIAFSKIFDFLAPKINAYFIQNGLIKDNAEELTQDVMSAIWTKSHLYTPAKSSLPTWVFTIARNKKVDFYRKNTKSNILEEDIRDFLYDNEDDEINQMDIKEQVNKISSELDDSQKKIIKMNFYENKSHKKIAEELEIPLGTVKSRIRHILIKMQRFII
tara:strand:+ start:4705 stop:5238 length:534 start_codon:yes stop_codon:yes gene_type:complete